MQYSPRTCEHEYEPWKAGSRVEKLILKDGRLTGVCTGSQDLPADAVILATGGKSYPSTGSTGEGYQLAERVGHTIVAARPALVPLETTGDDDLFKHLEDDETTTET